MVKASQTVQAAELIQDMDLYPRNKINRFHVNRLVETLKSGQELPPVHADRKTKIISDGFHRVQAYLQFAGPTSEVPVIWHDYESRAEMYQDGLRLNSQHGMAFSVFDLGRILITAKAFEIEIDLVCRILHITEHKAQKILNRIRPVRKDKGELKGETREIYVKRGMDKLIGQKSVTSKQQEVNEHALGVAPLRLANDLLAKIEGNCLLYTADLLFILGRLRDAIDTVLEAHKDVSEA